MESANYQRFEGSPSGKICRLRNGLNDDCLLEIFLYLSVEDLIQLCNLDVCFEGLITSSTLKNTVVDFGKGKLCDKDDLVLERRLEIIEIFKIFERFGKDVRKFIINTINLPLLLDTIMRYCTPAALTEIDLTIFNGVRVDPNLMELSMPFFSNLRKLAFRMDINALTERYTEFLTNISNTAPNLQILELQDIVIVGGWLKNFRNLRELRLQYKKESSVSFQDLTSCLRVNPKLKVFKFASEHDITTIGDVFSTYCSGLEEFCDENVRNPYDPDPFGVAVMNRYKFLASLPHLKTVTVTSYSLYCCDLYYALTSLATTNIVKLSVFIMDRSNPIALHKKEKANILLLPRPQFACLRTLEITNSGKYLMLCDLHLAFILHFVTHLENLLRLNLVGGFSRIHDLMLAAPNIRTMDLSKTASLPLQEVANIGRAVRRNREWKLVRKDRLLKLVLNDSHSHENFDKVKDAVKISFRRFGS